MGYIIFDCAGVKIAITEAEAEAENNNESIGSSDNVTVLQKELANCEDLQNVHVQVAEFEKVNILTMISGILSGTRFTKS